MKTIGILGGMGIDVTSELLTRIINATGAKKEQDNIPIIINHNPKIPDRTQAILYGGENPLAELNSSLKKLENAGVDFIAIPCNTAHYYYSEMQKSTPVPILHMIKEVVKKCMVIKHDLSCIGLLATTGAIKTELYQNEFKDKGIKVILPDKNDQVVVMGNIMRIKAREELSKIKRDFIRTGRELINKGAEIIIIGCTDISLAVKAGDLKAPIVDSLRVLAEKIVDLALVKEGR